MKPRYSVIVSAIGLVLVLLPSCNPEDPSAVREGQKIMAETLAKNARLEEEIVSLKAEIEKGGPKLKAESDQDVLKLKAELEEAKARITQSEAVKRPSDAEIEKKLELEGLKLKEEVRQLHPEATEVGFITADLTIPSFERPFRCKAKVVFKEAGGTLNTLYWTGSANIKGEWQFAKADHWEPKVDKKPDADTGFKPPTLTIVKDGDKRGLKDQPKQPDRTQQPDAPAQPKPKYDIDMKIPVMGPGSK
jgi:hypothetical protein